jgi:hypothetical protein
MDEEERSGGEKTRVRQRKGTRHKAQGTREGTRYKAQGARTRHKEQGAREGTRHKAQEQGTKSGTKNQGSRKFQITIINKSRINFKEKFNIPIEK